MDKSYIWIEEIKERMNEFSIGYTINPSLNINKSFKYKVTEFMKDTFDAITQPHTSKKNKKTRVLALLMFYGTRKKPKKVFKVLSCVIYTIEDYSR